MVNPQVTGGRDICSNGVGIVGTTSLEHLTLREGDGKACKEIIAGLKGLVWKERVLAGVHLTAPI